MPEISQLLDSHKSRGKSWSGHNLQPACIVHTCPACHSVATQWSVLMNTHILHMSRQIASKFLEQADPILMHVICMGVAMPNAGVVQFGIMQLTHLFYGAHVLQVRILMTHCNLIVVFTNLFTCHLWTTPRLVTKGPEA